MNKGLIAVIVLAVLIVAGYFVFGVIGDSEEEVDYDLSNANSEQERIELIGADLEGEREHFVKITDDGFVPSFLEIARWESVTFTNFKSVKSWPASNMHPTHRSYPGSDIDKCNTVEEAGIFDACRGLETGETYTFFFNEVGEWKYHDHLQAGMTGTIVVKEI